MLHGRGGKGRVPVIYMIGVEWELPQFPLCLERMGNASASNGGEWFRGRQLQSGVRCTLRTCLLARRNSRSVILDTLCYTMFLSFKIETYCIR